MTRVLIQVDAQLSDELTGAFPHLVAQRQPAATTLIGEVADQQEILGVLNLLESMGVQILLMVNIPSADRTVGRTRRGQGAVRSPD